MTKEFTSADVAAAGARIFRDSAALEKITAECDALMAVSSGGSGSEHSSHEQPEPENQTRFRDLASEGDPGRLFPNPSATRVARCCAV
jgi:hypothetical protein